MKKLKLELLSLGNSEVLTREQLKNVLGGRLMGSVTCNFGVNSSGCGAAGDLGDCGDDLDSCQDQADGVCEKYDCCLDATCKYA